MEKKYFTANEATKMIPQLERAFGRIHQIKLLSQIAFTRLEDLGFAPEDEHFRVHPAGAGFDVLDELAGLKILMLELREQIEALADQGCLVKDISLGLVDFSAKRQGREIFLCWQLGEKRVIHWHEVHTDFNHRQPLLKSQSNKTPPAFVEIQDPFLQVDVLN